MEGLRDEEPLVHGPAEPRHNHRGNQQRHPEVKVLVQQADRERRPKRGNRTPCRRGSHQRSISGTGNTRGLTNRIRATTGSQRNCATRRGSPPRSFHSYPFAFFPAKAVGTHKGALIVPRTSVLLTSAPMRICFPLNSPRAQLISMFTRLANRWWRQAANSDRKLDIVPSKCLGEVSNQIS